MDLSVPTDLNRRSWLVSRHCENGACVRVDLSGEMIFLGDSKNPDGPILSYTRSEWNAFVTKARLGEFDNF